MAISNRGNVLVGGYILNDQKVTKIERNFIPEMKHIII
jgi:hypothetical protein